MHEFDGLNLQKLGNDGWYCPDTKRAIKSELIGISLFEEISSDGDKKAFELKGHVASGREAMDWVEGKGIHILKG